MGPVGFDLDMTLIVARPPIMAWFAGLAADTGVPIDLAAVDSRLGIRLEDELAHWFPPHEIAEAAAGYRRHYLRVDDRADHGPARRPRGAGGGPGGGAAGRGHHRQAPGDRRAQA